MLKNWYRCYINSKMNWKHSRVRVALTTTDLTTVRKRTKKSFCRLTRSSKAKHCSRTELSSRWRNSGKRWIPPKTRVMPMIQAQLLSGRTSVIKFTIFVMKWRRKIKLSLRGASNWLKWQSISPLRCNRSRLLRRNLRLALKIKVEVIKECHFPN